MDDEYETIHDPTYHWSDDHSGESGMAEIKMNEHRDDVANAQKSYENVTPMSLRQSFLKKASPLMDNYIDSALGVKPLRSFNAHAQSAVWNVLKEIILTAKNPAPVTSIAGKTIDEQVSQILTLVFEGKIDVAEGRDCISLLQQGFELSEMPKLMKQMESLEALGVV